MVATALPWRVAHPQPSARERQRIERLLRGVEADPRVRFERNGVQVDGHDAARFLRAKWERFGSGVDTAESFIERIGSRSSTTGRAYLVCTSDTRCDEAGAWLRALLVRLDAQAERPSETPGR